MVKWDWRVHQTYIETVKMGKVQQTRLVVTCHKIRKVRNMMEWRAEDEIIG